MIPRVGDGDPSFPVHPKARAWDSESSRLLPVSHIKYLSCKILELYLEFIGFQKICWANDSQNYWSGPMSSA